MTRHYYFVKCVWDWGVGLIGRRMLVEALAKDEAEQHYLEFPGQPLQDDWHDESWGYVVYELLSLPLTDQDYEDYLPVFQRALRESVDTLNFKIPFLHALHTAYWWDDPGGWEPCIWLTPDGNYTVGRHRDGHACVWHALRHDQFHDAVEHYCDRFPDDHVDQMPLELDEFVRVCRQLDDIGFFDHTWETIQEILDNA